MNFALGGAFNSRINLNLREDKGYTYGARSGFGGNKEYGNFTARAGVRADATADSIIQVENEIYLKQLIIYIHNNPVKHDICDSTVEYQWTSYSSIISNKSTKLSSDFVIDLFDSINNYKSLHERTDNYNDIDFLLLD